MPANPHPEVIARDSIFTAQNYRELIDGLDDVVFRCDAHGRWVFLSAAWEARLAWKIPDSLGRAATRFLHPTDRTQVHQIWSEVLKGTTHACRREARFRTAAGEYRWMLVSARGTRDETGMLTGVTGTLTDVSVAKAVETDLEAARTAAENANRSKSEFLATMSHELRTPLNAVIGLSESLLETASPFEPDRTRRYVGIIHASGRQLLGQINDILDLARIEGGRLKVNAEPFDLRALCSAALDAAQRDIRAKNLTAQLLLPPESLVVNADERLLRQVLQNLLSNAVKFTPARGAVILTLAYAADGSVQMSVRDTGIGIPPDKFGQLFRPFSQIDSSLGRHFGGTGLGLALVERIARLHGATVSVESAPAQGSTFTLSLPASCVVNPSSSAASVPRSRRIVIVDDDLNQHLVVGDYLRERGFEVVHCESGAAAIAEINAHEPGLAIVDINMPGMTGLELIPRLRALPHGADLPILAVTALAEADEIQRCRTAGANAHLAKPISLAALAQRIAAFTAT